MPDSFEIPLQEAAFIAIKALAFISQIDAEMTKFLAETGLHSSDVIRLKENLDFLGGVLDFVNRDESLMMAFSTSEGFAPDRIEKAQLTLQGVGA